MAWQKIQINMIYIALLVALLLIGSIFRYLLRQPVYGVYLAFFTSGILKTVHLGPLRDKVGLTELVLLLTWLAMLLTRHWRQARVPLNNLQRVTLIAIALFISVEWLSLILNNMDFYGGLTGSIVEVMNLTYGALMAITLVTLLNQRTQFFMCLKFWGLGALVVSVIGCWALTGSAPAWTIDEFTGRISSTLKFENQVPSYLIPIFIPLVMSLFIREVKALEKFFLVFFALMISATLIGTGSRTSLLLLVMSVFVVSIIGFINLSNRSLYKGKLIMGIAGLCFALTSYITLALAAYDGHYALGHTPAWQRPVVSLYEGLKSGVQLDQTRQTQLSIVSNNIDKAMIIGNGPKLYGGKYKMEEIHNTYAGVYFETGLLGLVSFSILLSLVFTCGYQSLKHIPRNGERILIMSVIAAFIVLLLYGTTMYGLRQRNIWLMMGLLIALPSLYRKNV